MHELFDVACWLRMLADFFHKDNIHCLCLCLNRVSLQDCIAVLTKAGECYFLKAALRAYIRSIYLKQDSPDNLKMIITHLLRGMLEDLDSAFSDPPDIDMAADPDSRTIDFYRQRNLQEIALTVRLIHHRSAL